MHNIFHKTLGGLSPSYYIRHFCFGLIFVAMLLFVPISNGQNLQFDVIVLCLINSILYPYSRFVYESIMDFIMGNNTFFVNGLLFLIVKIFSMLLCWIFALFIAPLGLIYLYFYHTKNEKNL